MTTIAFKDGIVAADSQCTTSFKRFDSDKVHRIAKGPYTGCVFAGSGRVSTIQAMMAQVEAGELSAITSDDEATAVAIVIGPRGGFRVESDSMIPSRFRGCYAIGSGCDFAMGAMLAGKSAKEAVKIAAQLDIYTGGKVRLLEV